MINNVENKPSRIIILGYMGAGKTTLGHALSKVLDMPFYDLDWYIESRMRKTVSQIFEERGEEGFRTIERNMLHEVAEFENVIISCGGGTPCFFDNMEYINQQGETVYLSATPEILYQHLQMGKKERPLLKGKSEEELKMFMQTQLNDRNVYYNQAKRIFRVELMDTRDKIQFLAERLINDLGIKKNNTNIKL